MKTTGKLIIILILRTSLLAIASPVSNDSKHKVNWNNLKLPGITPKKSNEESQTSRSDPGAGKIVGGENASVGEYPYHVGIVPNFGAWCGGSLISSQFVMTAAHCTYECSYVFVYLGAHDIRADEESQLEFQVRIDDIVHHPDWNFAIFDNDIALINLPQKIQFTTRIQPISLPSRSDIQYDLENEYVVATGWGYISANSTGIVDILQHVRLRIQPLAVCQHFYPRIVTETNICTDTGLGRGICTRDDGGPLMYVRKDELRIVVGVNSFLGILGCDVGWPTMHTRVSKYIDWIAEVTGIPLQD